MINRNDIEFIRRGSDSFNLRLPERSSDMIDEKNECRIINELDPINPLQTQDLINFQADSHPWEKIIPYPTDNSGISLSRGKTSEKKSKSRKKISIKKSSLKFCRKLCKTMLATLEREAFTKQVFHYFSSLILSYAAYMGLRITCSEQVVVACRVIFHTHWKTSRRMVSSFNKKICLVTQTEWDCFFDFQGFTAELDRNQDIFKEILDIIHCKDPVNRECFLGLLKRSLFILNLVFVNTVLHCELAKDKKFLERVPNFDVFALMVVEPWLCKHFNHTKEKFARECCGKCKVCCSGLIPVNFLTKLKIARIRFSSVKEFYERFGDNGLGSLNEEDVRSIFSFWANRYNEGHSLLWSETSKKVMIF